MRAARATRRTGWSILAGGMLLACASSRRAPPAAPSPSATPVAPPPAASSSSVATTAPPPSKPPSACKPIDPGTTSDDETPTIGGTTHPDPMLLFDWLDARGVGHDVAAAWLAGRYGIAKDQAESFTYSPCGKARLGQPAEEALVCEVAVPASLMQVHALAVVVRNKRPAAILDVGVGMVAMDFPDARWLDLSLVLAADGQSATLADRAPDGTTLVEAPSHCRAEEQRIADCERKLAEHPNPESLAHRMSHGRERFDSIDLCVLYRGKDGRLAVFHRTENDEPPIRVLPATLHDCAKGRAGLEAMQGEMAQGPPDARAETRKSLAFFDKTCGQRGRYAWQRDRFVRVR